MKILSIQELAIPEIKVIRFARFCDHRGYFTESYRESDFQKMEFMRDVRFLQCNESFSKVNTIRGLHYQWNPYMGKLIRTLQGRMVDLVLDISKGSPTFGKIIAWDMPSRLEADFNEWIWVPPGFAHGNFFTEPTTIQYFCSGSYNPECEAGISPFADDIDWSLCDPGLKQIFDTIKTGKPLMTDKDINGYTLESWTQNPSSNQFVY